MNYSRIFNAFMQMIMTNVHFVWLKLHCADLILCKLEILNNGDVLLLLLKWKYEPFQKVTFEFVMQISFAMITPNVLKVLTFNPNAV